MSLADGQTIRDLFDENPGGEGEKGPEQQQEGSYWRNISKHEVKSPWSRLQTVLAVVLKLVRMNIYIGWQLIGYIFETIMVSCLFPVALVDCLINCIGALLGEDARSATHFKITDAYSKWLNDTYMIAFETLDSRQTRNNVKKLDKLHRKQLFEKVVTNGLLKSAAASKSLDIRHLDSNASLVFVVTDIEGSTSAQVQSPKAYQGMILIHDCILREALYAHKGLELDTEGDSFRVAFAEPVDALKFCMEVQESLLQVKWPKIMRKIAAFKVMHDKDGNLMFAGPRVRMGVHLADPEEFEVKFSQRQKPVISGPGWSSALQMGDVGSGGQIIISSPVFSSFQHNLADAGFPTVKHLGAYVFDKLQPGFSTDVFQVTSSFDSGLLQRRFSPLRGCAQIARAVPMHGSTMHEGDLALVALRASQYDNLTQQASISSFRIDKSKINKADQRAMQVSEQNRELLVLTIDSIAQQFQGCKFSVENQLEEFQFIAFNTIADACRFCIAIQVGLLCADWPLNPLAQFVGNNLIYRGPTLACAIHATNSTEDAAFYRVLNSTSAGRKEDQEKVYAGSSLGALQALLGLCNPGQVILSQNAWHGIQYSLGEICQPFVIDLGVHRVSNVGLELGRIMEILPRELKGRVFNDLSSIECIAPGARQSPYVADGVAFVFTSPCLGEENSTPEIEEAVQVFVSATRQMLNTKNNGNFGGYECQEVGAGNFMLAFRSLELAMTYTKEIMEYLVSYKWSNELLKTFPSGLPIKMGIGFGKPYYSMPHPNTGRADYFGPVVNMVARVKQAAKPGQVLLALKSKTDPKRKKTQEIITKYSNKGFKLVSLGKHNLRGIAGTVALAELEILGRTFGFKVENRETSPLNHTIDISKLPTQAFNTVQDRLARAEHYLSKTI